MLKSRKEILDEIGNMVDMVGTLYDEREDIWRKYCKCSRDLKLTEEKLANQNFKIEKVLQYINKTQEGMVRISKIEDILKENENE